MANEISNSKFLKKLLEFYGEDLALLSRSPLTGADIELPKDLQNLSEILNMCLYKPEVLLVWSSPLAYSQLNIYRPYLKRKKRRTAIICNGLKGKSHDEINLPQTPVYVNNKNSNLERIMSAIPGAQTLLYITEKAENLKYVKTNPALVHVFANHGDSDKHSNANRLGPAYDFMMVSDGNAIQRFVRAGIQVPIEKFLLVGGSPIEGVVPAENGASDFRNVLYAPTWEGHRDTVNFSSMLKVAPQMHEFVKSGGNLSFQPHPGLGSRRADFASEKVKLQKITTENPAQSKSKNFNWSDVVVTNISGVLSEYLFTKKPLIVPVGDDDDWIKDYFNRTGLGSYVYNWPYKEKSLSEMLGSISSDPLRERRLSRCDQLFHRRNSIDGLASLFDEALELCSLSQKQKALRAPFSAPQQEKFDFSRTPDDEELADIVKKVRAGRLRIAP